jgi:hypothetical protein
LSNSRKKINENPGAERGQTDSPAASGKEQIRLFVPSGAERLINALNGIKAVRKGSFSLNGYAYFPNADFECLREDKNGVVDGAIYGLSADAVWEFDKYYSPAVVYKKKLPFDGGVYGLFMNSSEKTDGFAAAREERADKCDLYLMIPGYYDRSRKLPVIEHVTGRHINESIKAVANAEFDGGYIKSNSRVTLGTVTLSCCDFDNCESAECEIQECKRLSTSVTQLAVANLLYHNETNLCVVEIYVPNTGILTQRLLSNYCANRLNILRGDGPITLKGYLDSLGITVYGGKRSMAFVCEDIDDETLLNILVNEVSPMGKIVGDHFGKIIANNLAQYDTARVYASETTMVEIVKEPAVDVFGRIKTQAIEIFFVEMLLLQDAAVSRMNQKVKEKVVVERDNPYNKETKETINELIQDMSHAINFADYKQFYFPTVRVSAEEIARAFGLRYISEKFEQNKELLQQMIDGHAKKIEDKENAIKNTLLFFLTFFSGIGTIASIIGIILGSENATLSFYISFGIMSAGVLLYIVSKRLIRFALRKKRNRRHKDV